MTLNLAKVSNVYFEKLFAVQRNESSTNSEIKAKVLLVDKFTTPIISMCYTQSQLLQNDIILIELIENQSTLNVMKHLNCIVYIKPTRESIQSLIKELNNPHFSKYQLFLNNTISKGELERLAEADEFEVINQVTEIFQDYLILNDNLFTINVSEPIANAINPVVEESNSLVSLLLSLKKCPIIKYESNSLELKRLSSEILYNINSNSNNNLFDDLNRKSDRPPLLLLLDRKNDPITPLITPWTYQSMIHEFLGIKKNIVALTESKEQVTLNESQDKFYRESMYLNYGDLTEKFQKYVEEYKKETKQSSLENLKTQNLSELKKMLTKFPEFKKLSNNILKHLNLISEIDKEISIQNLWEIGELQQTIICELDTHQAIRQKLTEILDNPKVSTTNKIKLVLLYSIRFHNTSELQNFIGKLNNPLVTDPLPTLSQIALLKKFKTLFNSNFTTSTSGQNNSNNLGNIFQNKKININSFFNQNKSNDPKTDNIYLQYTPRLNEVLNSLLTTTQSESAIAIKSSLSTLIPDAVSSQYGNNIQNEPVQDVIIYVKGGVTFEEARLVFELSESNKKINLVIGGDNVLNSEMWMKELYDRVNDSEIPGTDPATDRRKQLREIL
ncbi:vacuolar protein sorting associated protein [Scheffersomyces stipitis CBS 6054]|uniref:Vacuolar protein sorting associated protein n=1 Tax=Scheffersomyces stipitis (strain ATCC 58785 / CBS 6054 / NBRC 10063 / NRRL Y-11545) TaxID=322104 RepID=A3LRH9_PICST|nr:vacuolar protein sorting associated protein [Scheffersomyces stipitis CBS 6054]ABN65738.2 vacuolar protein sorting associated protein [Scheffersomyces stipitis CBS 6054]